MAKVKSEKSTNSADTAANLGFEAKLRLAADYVLWAPIEARCRRLQGKANWPYQSKLLHIVSMHCESRALVTLRDTLLPKLLGGEPMPSFS